VIVPVIVIEETGVVDSLRRSWALIWPRFWPYFGTIIVAVIVSYFAQLVASIPFLIFSAIAAWIDFAPLRFAADSLLSIESILIAVPISAVIATLLYFDARVRHEGFDIQMMAANLPNANQPPPPPQSNPYSDGRPPEQGGFPPSQPPGPPSNGPF